VKNDITVGGVENYKYLGVLLNSSLIGPKIHNIDMTYYKQFYAAIPTLFPCFLPFCYPYIYMLIVTFSA